MASNGRATAAIEYLNQALDDAEVRKNVARALGATQRASGQLAGRRPATKGARKKRLQRQLREAVLSLGRAGVAAREAERKRERSQRRRRILLLVLVGGSVAIGLSGPARRKVLGLFGGQDEVSEPPAASSPQAQQTSVEPG
jgi:hypothetical protein